MDGYDDFDVEKWGWRLDDKEMVDKFGLVRR